MRLSTPAKRERRGGREGGGGGGLAVRASAAVAVATATASAPPRQGRKGNRERGDVEPLGPAARCARCEAEREGREEGYLASLDGRRRTRPVEHPLAPLLMRPRRPQFPIRLNLLPGVLPSLLDGLHLVLQPLALDEVLQRLPSSLRVLDDDCSATLRVVVPSFSRLSDSSNAYARRPSAGWSYSTMRRRWTCARRARRR